MWSERFHRSLELLASDLGHSLDVDENAWPAELERNRLPFWLEL